MTKPTAALANLMKSTAWQASAANVGINAAPPL